MEKKSIRKTTKRIIKLSILIGIKEAYLLGRNLLGLAYHPFLTLRTIKKERDFSQTVLISFSILSPLILVLTITVIIYLISFFLFSIPTDFKKLILSVDLATFLFTLIVIFYLFYWSLQVIRKNHFFHES